jgi:hypothetical protein
LVVATLEIAGGELVVVVVVNVELPDAEDCPATFAETTSKSYVVPGVSPVTVTECVVTSVGSSAEADPYAAVAPKFTSEDEAWSVVHVIVAVVLLVVLTTTLEIAGGSVGAVPVVVNVIVLEYPVAPSAPVDCATK